MSVIKIAWRLQKAKALRDYIGRYTAGNKIIVQNEVPVGLNVSWQLERSIVGAKTLTRDHSNYIETPNELAQSSPDCTQTL